MSRAILLVIDGLGCGAQEDSAAYGDEQANTLLHVLTHTGMRLPQFEAMGLGNILALPGIPPATHPTACHGKMRERSAGKDSTTGHWEMADILLTQPFPTYPEGFPSNVVETLKQLTGSPRILCNLPYSGSEVIKDYGDIHLATGAPIVYTSADSVLQIAAHVDIVPLETLYAWCAAIRDHYRSGPHAVGRIIARPFKGGSGAYERISEKRKDSSLIPQTPHLLSQLQAQGIQTHTIGKVIDLFGGVGFDDYQKTENNRDGMQRLLHWLQTVTDDRPHFQFVNLIDTDQLFGHRNDPLGYAQSLQEIDQTLPLLMQAMHDDDLLLITGDHGNDPTTPGTDHTREFVPLWLWTPRLKEGISLGVMDGFDTIAHTIRAYFNVTSGSTLKSKWIPFILA
jgi:phosphopentomutase